MRNILGIVVISVVMFAAGYVGFYFINRNRIFNGSSLLDQVVRLIDKHYVDTVDVEQLQSETIPLMLKGLDPHSAYLSKEINQAESERLDGSFSGIGVQFNTITDTVVVVKVIPGGPSERAGIKPGDRILQADNKKLYGKGVTQDSILKSLKGPHNSVVKLDVLRNGSNIKVNVVRDDVPVNSIDAEYKINNDILYLKLTGWGRKTHAEVLTAYAENRNKLKGIILDLRQNSGGYLESAVALSSEFLPKNKLVLYAEGKSFPREDIRTERDGLLKDVPLTILVDEFSASSSEIFAGAMQDHDRARIIGRRTFGKGLVQRPYLLPDSSVIRLTVARYYTPSGRCIQKKYGKNDELGYEEDIQNRFLHGEFYSADSIQIADTVKYFTDGGRTVYSGGGITPDTFVPRDSVGITSYYLRLMESGVFQKFTFLYSDRNRARLSEFKTIEELVQHLSHQDIARQFARYANDNGVEMRTMLFERSQKLIFKNLCALITEYFFDREGLYRILNTNDRAVDLAVEAIKNNDTNPGKKKPIEGVTSLKRDRYESSVWNQTVSCFTPKTLMPRNKYANQAL